MRCGACGDTMAPTFRRRLLSQGQVQYFECRSCGFTRTEDPTWLAEAYSRPISRLDTGAIARNLSCARDLRLLLPRWFGWGGRYLDFAGGHGVLTRLMRDHGLDYYWADRYADNLFAGGFEWSTGLSRPRRSARSRCSNMLCVLTTSWRRSCEPAGPKRS